MFLLPAGWLTFKYPVFLGEYYTEGTWQKKVSSTLHPNGFSCLKRSVRKTRAQIIYFVFCGESVCNCFSHLCEMGRGMCIAHRWSRLISDKWKTHCHRMSIKQTARARRRRRLPVASSFTRCNSWTPHRLMIPASFRDHEQDVSDDLRGLISGLGAKISAWDTVYFGHAESRDVWGV